MRIVQHLTDGVQWQSYSQVKIDVGKSTDVETTSKHDAVAVQWFKAENSSSMVRITSSVIIDIECSSYQWMFSNASNILLPASINQSLDAIVMIHTGSAGIIYESPFNHYCLY